MRSSPFVAPLLLLAAMCTAATAAACAVLFHLIRRLTR